MIKITSTYKNLWMCRDLEIQMLWTRLTLQGTIMALTYTGYGVLLVKMLEHPSIHWNTCNLLAILTCSCGMVFSCLWITTAKGSKRWFEQYEAALRQFQTDNQDLFESYSKRVYCLSYLDFDRKLGPWRQKEDDSLFTSFGGCFSVSKIPIVLGQVSLWGWGMFSCLHLAALFLGKQIVKELFDRLGLQFGAFMILTTLLVISIVCSRIKSSFKPV